MFITTLPHDQQGDLAIFLIAGRAARQGLNPYAVYALTPRVNGLPTVNLNPPISVLLFQQLAGFAPLRLLPIWYSVGLAAYIVTLFVLIDAYPQHDVPLRVVWALSLSGVWQTLRQSESYLAVALIGALAWVALVQRKETTAGLFLGVLVAFKPNFILWPALLFPSGYRRVSVIAGLSATALSLWPAAIYGLQVYPEWLVAVRQTPALHWGLYGAFADLAATLGQSALVLPARVVLVLVLAVLVYRRRPSDDDACAIGIVASLVFLPWTLQGYLLLLLPLFFNRPWSGLTRVAAILLVSTMGVVPEPNALS